MNTELKDASVRHWLVAVGAGLLMVAASAVVGLSFQVVPVSTAFKISIPTLMIYYSIYTVGSAISMASSGRIASKIGMKPVVIVGGLLSTIAFLGMSMALDVITLYICAFLLGLGWGGSTSLAATVLVTNWFDKRRGTVMGAVMACSGLGGIFLGLVLPRIIQSMGWQAGYVGLAMFMFVFVVLPGVFLIGSYPAKYNLLPYGALAVAGEEPVTIGAEKDTGVKYSRALRSSALYILFAAMFCLSLCSVVQQYYPTIIQSRGIDAVAVGTLVSILSAGLIVGKILVGYLRDKMGMERALIIPTLLGVGGFVALTFFTGYAPIAIAMVFMGVGLTTSTVLIPSFGAKVFGTRDFAGIYGLILMGTPIASAIGAPLWGLIAQAAGGYNSVLLGCAALLVLAALLLIASRRAAKRLDRTGEVSAIPSVFWQQVT